LSGVESGGGTYPGLTLVMVDAHHLPPAEADQGDEGGQSAAIRPYIKDTDFGLSGSEWGLNYGYEGDPFLEQVVRALGRGDGGEVGIGGGELDALAGEGEEGLKNPGYAVGLESVAKVGVAVKRVEEEGGRDGGMMQEGDGEFADVEIPVRMTGPFEVEGLAVVEAERDLFADELVDDGAVVDAADGDEARAVAVGEAAKLAR
jgi:hypothetical protein